MGTRIGPTYFLTWQSTLAGMLDAGTRVKERCPKCDTWDDVDVVDLLCYHGPNFSLVNYHPACGRCGGPVNFHASPGSATPFRPLFTDLGRPLA